MDEKAGVFISHITEQRGTALLLKDLLQRVFTVSLPVFVSSDYESISGGDVWFQRIVNGLNSSAVVIVLLSPDSLDRRWINFEAGVGIGANIPVIPVVVHGLERDEVGHPLSSLQIRSLETVKDTYALLNDVRSRVGGLMKAMVSVDELVAHAGQRMGGSGWVGVEWQQAFLAIDGPLAKLPKTESQAYIESMSNALRQEGFTPRLANRNRIGLTVGAGYKIVYITDRKTFRAEIVDLDVILTAKQEIAKS